jgi:hypothetical protein
MALSQGAENEHGGAESLQSVRARDVERGRDRSIRGQSGPSGLRMHRLRRSR